MFLKYLFLIFTIYLKSKKIIKNLSLEFSYVTLNGIVSLVIDYRGKLRKKGPIGLKLAFIHYLQKILKHGKFLEKML